MVRRWHLLILLFATGCNAPAAVDHASIIADIAVRYAAIVCRPQPTPTPDEPKEGCVAGCGCNGTGKEKSGDGLAVVNCRCDDDCECKPKIEPAPAEPPLVPIKSKPSSGRIECSNGTCYWVDDATGQRYRVVR
jgi:hypothetical protein